MERPLGIAEGSSYVGNVIRSACRRSFRSVPLRLSYDCKKATRAYSWLLEFGLTVYALHFFAGDLYPAGSVFRMVAQRVVVLHEQFDLVAALLAVGQHFV